MSGSSRGEAARLREELRAFGRSLDGPGGSASPESMAERVLEQILAEGVPAPAPVPVAEEAEARTRGARARPYGAGQRARLRGVRRWARLRWRSLVAALCGLLTVCVLTPPVRATVSDWFVFGGVEVRRDPSAEPSPGPGVPGCGPPVPLGRAARQAGFRPLVPAALGTPDAVAVDGLPGGRSLVSLCWREGGHTIRLDEFPARLDPMFAKLVREQPEWLTPGGEESGGGGADGSWTSGPVLWFARPHRLVLRLVDADGHRFAREQRTAGPTLLWTVGGGDAEGAGGAARDGVTLRLEGVASKARALEIARSLEEVGTVDGWGGRGDGG
ncbi:hypothetical protein [Streptomyces sp. NPDC029526]|uniref:hypothetical protein n=1 Tax=Streptomyces sp. NPDC029526 TaxID=3155728 RepID=UPI0033C5881F